MRLAFIHHAWMPDVDERPYRGSCGGAGLSSLRILQEGRRRGHKIDIIGHARPGYCFDGYDGAIFSHITGTPRSIIEHFRRIPYVFWEHQYFFCRYVDRLSRECSPERCDGCAIPCATQLHRGAKLCVYQSPLHWSLHAALGIASNDPQDYLILVPPIDTLLFHPGVPGSRDRNNVLYVGTLAPHKGIENVVQFVRDHPEFEYGFCGDRRKDFKGKEWLFSQPNVTYHCTPHNADLPAIYARYGRFIHLPVWQEPSGRTCMEAALVGLDLIWNDNVGTKSFDFPWRDPGMLCYLVRQSPQTFWERTEKALQ